MLVGDAKSRVAAKRLTSQVKANAVVQSFLHSPQKGVGRALQVRIERFVLHVPLVGCDSRDERHSGQQFQNQHGDDQTPGDGGISGGHNISPRNL